MRDYDVCVRLPSVTLISGNMVVWVLGYDSPTVILRSVDTRLLDQRGEL